MKVESKWFLDGELLWLSQGRFGEECILSFLIDPDCDFTLQIWYTSFDDVPLPCSWTIA